MAYKNFGAPGNIYYGIGSLESLTTISASRVLIVTDPGVRKVGLVDRVEKILRTNNTSVATFDQVEADPSKETVWSIFALARDFKPDLFIGLGGGSSIDAGKASWVLYEHPEFAELPFLEFLKQASSCTLRKKAHYVAIPTTSGTASEVTRVAIVTDRSTTPPFKGAIGTYQIVPDIAILDPELPATMPPEVTANTGYDALVHAIECYVVIPPMDMIDPLALWAAKTIMQWLPKAVDNGKDMEAREKMHIASLQAGLAFSNGGLGLVHSGAHQLGAQFHIAHGRTVAYMICPVLASWYPFRKSRLVSLAESLGINGKDDATKVTKLLDKLDELKKTVGIPLSIQESGLKKSEFQQHVDEISKAYFDQMYRSNPATKKLTPEELRASFKPGTVEELVGIFWQAWDGRRAIIK